MAYTKPSNNPRWTVTDGGAGPIVDNNVTNGTSGQSNVAEPSSPEKDLGWDFNQYAPRQWDNWFKRLVSKWIPWLQQQSALNTTHRDSNGTTHANVVLADDHRAHPVGHTDVTLNNTHRSSDSGHPDVIDNTTHSDGDGSDHGDVADNTIHSDGAGADHADVAANTSGLITEISTRDTNDKNSQGNLASADQSALYAATNQTTLQNAISYEHTFSGPRVFINGLSIDIVNVTDFEIKRGMCTSQYVSPGRILDFGHSAWGGVAGFCAADSAFQWQLSLNQVPRGALADSITVLANNTWYYLFAVQNWQFDSWGFCIDDNLSGTNVQNTTSASGNGSTGDVQYRRYIGAIKTAAGSTDLMLYRSHENRFLWKSVVEDVFNSTPAADVTVSTPFGVNTTALLNILAESLGIGKAYYRDGILGSSTSTEQGQLHPRDQTGSEIGTNCVDVELMTDQNSRIHGHQSGDPVAWTIRTRGWIDLRNHDVTI